MVQLTHCVVDLERRWVRTGDHTVPLTSREANLLAYLLARPSQVVSREELLREVWGYHGDVLSRAIDNVVCRLRSKVEIDPLQPAHLLTEHGTGYRFVLRADAPVAERCTDTDLPQLWLSGGAVDLTRGEVHRADGRVSLAAGELALLRELVRTAGIPVDPLQLERRIWGSVLPGSKRLRNVVCRLRAKIEQDPSDPKHLLLGVKGRGYRFVLPEIAPTSGISTVLVLDAGDVLGASAPGSADAVVQTLWHRAIEVAGAFGGYASALVGARAWVVFGRADAAVRAGMAVSGEFRIGLATGESQRIWNPLSRRFEYVGPAVVRATDRCRHLQLAGRSPSETVLADEAAERVAAA